MYFFEVITSNGVLRWNQTLLVTLDCYCVECLRMIKKKENKQDVGVGGSEPKRTERY